METSFTPISVNHHRHNFHYDKPQYEVADILVMYLPEYLKEHKLSSIQLKAVNDIMNCRTSALGCHKLKCDQCNYERLEYACVFFILGSFLIKGERKNLITPIL